MCEYINTLLGVDVAGFSRGELEFALQSLSRRRVSKSRRLAVFDLIEGERVLDIGCEIGVIAHAVSKCGATVAVYDIREGPIEIAEFALSAPNIFYTVGDPLTLGLPEPSIDCALFLETIKHVDEPMKALRELHRLLRPNGTLLLSTPNAMFYHEFLRQFVRLWPSFRSDTGTRTLVKRIWVEEQGSGTQENHIYSSTWETLARLVGRSGFAYEAHRRVGFGLPSLPLGSRRLWPLGRREFLWLVPFLDPFCQNLSFKAADGRELGALIGWYFL